jgi:hypothetical protein
MDGNATTTSNIQQPTAQQQNQSTPQQAPTQAAQPTPPKKEGTNIFVWILVAIGVILFSVFQLAALGLFNHASVLPTSCIPAPGWICSDPFLSGPSGTLSFTLGQNIGVQVANVIVACAAASSASGFPIANSGGGGIAGAGYPGFYPITSIGTVGTDNTVPSDAVMTNESTLDVTGLPCYQSTGSPLGADLAIGTPFTGTIWVGYNSSGTLGPIDTVVKIDTLSVWSS